MFRFKHPKSLPVIALLIGTTALAFAPIFVRLSEVTPSSVAFWRMALSTPILAMAWVFMPMQKQDKNASKPTFKDYFGLLLAGLFFTLDIVLLNSALDYTSIANASLFVNCASLFVALIGWAFLKHTLSNGLIAGMFVALAGSILIVWPNFGSENSSLFGDILSILAAIFYALYLLFVQLARKKFSTLSIMIVTGVVTTFSAAFIAFFLEESLMIEMVAWPSLIALAIIVQIFGQGFIAFALAFLSATLSSIVLLLQPVISALVAWKLFDETLVFTQIMGMSIVIAGIAFAKIASKEKDKQDPEAKLLIES